MAINSCFCNWFLLRTKIAIFSVGKCKLSGQNQSLKSIYHKSFRTKMKTKKKSRNENSHFVRRNTQTKWHRAANNIDNGYCILHKSHNCKPNAGTQTKVQAQPCHSIQSHQATGIFDTDVNLCIIIIYVIMWMDVFVFIKKTIYGF